MRRCVAALSALLLLAGCLAPSVASPQAPPTTALPTLVTSTPAPLPTVPLTATASPTPVATATVETPIPVPSATPTQALPATSQLCEITATADTVIYDRPSTEASVFGTLEVGASIEAEARTEDGWYGFDPHIAQAANIGPFRLRWVYDAGSLQFSGNCEDLPVIVGPPPGVCFTMPMEDLDVHAAPSASSDVVTRLEVGDYAAVLARGEEWSKIDLAPGNTGLEIQGWIPTRTLNLNGPCDDLPTSVP